MSHCLRLLLVILLLVNQEADLAIAVRKFVYQKDMSEYCRRRVIPSVFLGRQVIDAYSEILHFSRLELPYSCFVSIRTESGSNIILVIQLMSDKSLIEACHESKNQLLVYEIGETFGGYWGALPNNVMKSAPPKDKHRYTLKTTQPTTTTTTEKRTTRQRTSPSSTENSDDAMEKSSFPEDDIIVEVPIVNVSAVLVPGSLPIDTLFDPRESFDAMIDVKPRPGVSYKTKVLPIVQFAIADEVSASRTSGETGAPQHQLNRNAALFTPDARLSYPLLRLSTKTKQREKYKYYVNSRLDFTKNKKLSIEKEVSLYRTSPSHDQSSFGSQPSHLFTRPYDFRQPLSQKETKHALNSFGIVDAILKNISKTKENVPNTNMKIDKNVVNLLQGLAKIRHNKSVFLVPNSSWYARRPASTTRLISTMYRTDLITWRQPSASYRTNYLEEVEDTLKAEGSSQDPNRSSSAMTAMNNNYSVIINDERSGALLPLTLDVDRFILNVTQQNNMENTLIINPVTLASEVSGTSTTATTPKTVQPMTLVDHESWENMVHAASLMAVVLNQSITSSEDNEKQGPNATLLPPSKVMRRKKRYMHAIPIEDAKPHHLPVKIDIPSSNKPIDKISVVQELQQHIEQQDDEIHDRVALRYMHRYVGPALYNICDFDKAAARHVYLFNSSRLVLAITNFTFERMTVVLTTARTLLTSDARCESAHLECQVSGARVCIDSLNACDGVPNCGSYDIYDEDRLTCGGSSGLQHNVCLAAITFLAVLLTILYTIHYWLKRCVPKVSDAFFIYTDAAENILYLDPIMRSPHDTDDPKDFYRGGAMQDFMECTVRIKKNTVGSYISRFFRLFGCRRKKRMSRVLDDQIIEGEYDEHLYNRRLNLFDEVELSKMGPALMTDAAVQTGLSFESQVIETPPINERMTQDDSDIEALVAHYERKRRSILDLKMLNKEPSDELSILNFFRQARSVSMQMSSHEIKNADIQAKHPTYTEEREMHAIKHPRHTEEKEIQCLEYDHYLNNKPLTERVITLTDEITVKKPVHDLVRKKLRFEEETKILEANEDDALEEEFVPERHRRSVVHGGVKNVHSGKTESNSNDDEPSTSTNREFKSYFWGSAKNKPKKSTNKKMQLHLR